MKHLSACETTNSATERLARAREVAAENRKAGISQERRSPIEKAAANPKSLRLAITAKCYDCEGRDSDPNPRGRVRECSIRTCPLWPVRPWQRDDSEAEA